MREEVGNWLGYTGSGIIALHYVKPSDFLQLLAPFLRLAGCEFFWPQVFPSHISTPPPQVLGNYSRRGSYWAQGKTHLKPAKRCTEGTSTCLVLKINIFKVVLERHVEVLASDCLFFHTKVLLRASGPRMNIQRDHLYSRNRDDTFQWEFTKSLVLTKI